MSDGSPDAPVRFPDGRPIPITPVADLPEMSARKHPQYGDLRLVFTSDQVITIRAKPEAWRWLGIQLLLVVLAMGFGCVLAHIMAALFGLGRGNHVGLRIVCLTPIAPMALYGACMSWRTVRSARRLWRASCVLDRRERRLYWPHLSPSRTGDRADYPLDRVLAVQTCSRTLTERYGMHEYFQLILVIMNGERVCLLSDRNLTQVRGWARRLAGFLDRPLVDDTQPTQPASPEQPLR